jgi:N,N'-diacetyllegionaminate synthase
MIELIAELATAHGGDVDLACDMVQAAADSGAHTVKIQSYTLAKLNPRDPQADWLRQAHFDRRAHETVMDACQKHKVQFLSTPFDVDAFAMLVSLGLKRFKVASNGVVPERGGQFIKSWPWGRKDETWTNSLVSAHLTAIPLYPTPLEAISVVELLDGWSDHTIGTAACQYMLSHGARIIEAHFCVPGRSRQKDWDKTPEQFREIRDWADTVQTMTTGVSTVFRERWSA